MYSAAAASAPPVARAAARAVTSSDCSTARVTLGTSVGISRAGMSRNVKIARRTCSAKSASVLPNPASTASRVAATEEFRIAPTRCTGGWAKAEITVTQYSAASDAPIRATAAGVMVLVCDTA